MLLFEFLTLVVATRGASRKLSYWGGGGALKNLGVATRWWGQAVETVQNEWLCMSYFHPFYFILLWVGLG